MDDYLASVYYDTKRSGGFGGVDRLYKDVKKEGKFNISRTKIKEWLMKQDTYRDRWVVLHPSQSSRTRQNICRAISLAETFKSFLFVRFRR